MSWEWSQNFVLIPWWNSILKHKTVRFSCASDNLPLPPELRSMSSTFSEAIWKSMMIQYTFHIKIFVLLLPTMKAFTVPIRQPFDEHNNGFIFLHPLLTFRLRLSAAKIFYFHNHYAKCFQTELGTAFPSQRNTQILPHGRRISMAILRGVERECSPSSLKVFIKNIAFNIKASKESENNKRLKRKCSKWNKNL